MQEEQIALGCLKLLIYILVSSLFPYFPEDTVITRSECIFVFLETLIGQMNVLIGKGNVTFALKINIFYIIKKKQSSPIGSGPSM